MIHFTSELHRGYETIVKLCIGDIWSCLLVHDRMTQ
jgi:hypothetical protein